MMNFYQIPFLKTPHPINKDWLSCMQVYMSEEMMVMELLILLELEEILAAI
ncbi:hypothetical protein D3C87_2184250 [compost metagenome]